MKTNKTDKTKTETETNHVPWLTVDGIALAWQSPSRAKVKPKFPIGTKFYIAGPMSGLPQFNFPAFDAAVLRVKERGYIPISPADLDDPEARRMAMVSPDGAPGSASPNGKTWADFLARDVKLIADEADGLAVLPGWEKSRGACLETFVAALCRKPIVWEDTFKPVTKLQLASAWISIAMRSSIAELSLYDDLGFD